MTATIIKLKKDKTSASHNPDLAYILAREIMREYEHTDITLVEKAIEASNFALNNGGRFFDAMEAADRTIREGSAEGYQREEAERNFQRLMLFRRRRQRLADTLLCVTAAHIRFRMRQYTELEISAAVERARRVLEGGGDIGHALHLALPDDLPALK